MQLVAVNGLLLLSNDFIQLIPLGLYGDKANISRIAGIEYVPHVVCPPIANKRRDVNPKRAEVHKVIAPVHHHVVTVARKRDGPWMKSSVVILVGCKCIITRPGVIVRPEIKRPQIA